MSSDPRQNDTSETVDLDAEYASALAALQDAKATLAHAEVASAQARLQAAALAQRPVPRTGYRGVSYHQASSQWEGCITVRGTKHYLGLFATPQAAALAYDAKALALGARHPRLNYPSLSETTGLYAEYASALAALRDAGDDAAARARARAAAALAAARVLDATRLPDATGSTAARLVPPGSSPQHGSPPAAQSAPSTDYRGVSFHRASRQWEACLTARGKKHYIGLFATPRLAALAYDAKALELVTEHPRLNFPSLFGTTDIYAEYASALAAHRDASDDDARARARAEAADALARLQAAMTAAVGTTSAHADGAADGAADDDADV